MSILIPNEKKSTVNFSKEMLILEQRFYILDFTETKKISLLAFWQ